MRKNIDIPEEIVKDLKKMAIDADKDWKILCNDTRLKSQSVTNDTLYFYKKS